MTLTCSSQGRPPAAVLSRRPIGNSLLYASTSQISPTVSNSQSAIDVFKRVVTPTRAILGIGNNDVMPSSGCSIKDINVNDSIEVALASNLQDPTLAHVAVSTSHAYVGPWNAFVLWCSTSLRPRTSLPGDYITVALYIQSLMNSSKSFSTIKSASTSIVFFHKIILFTNHPAMALEVCMVRTTSTRKFGLSPKRVKERFMWMDLVNFALLYGVHSQGYCHLVVTTMAISSFGAMCRYSDVSRLKWGNIKFESDLSSFEITFEI
jgi:hypothetical protein